jgi:hypothetical protein
VEEMIVQDGPILTNPRSSRRNETINPIGIKLIGYHLLGVVDRDHHNEVAADLEFGGGFLNESLGIGDDF